MLETTLSSSFVPGVNIKGQVAGANWMFLRPSIRAEHVICLGLPAASTLATLGRFSGTVTLLPGARQARAAAAVCRAVGLPNVRAHVTRDMALPLPDGTADTLMIVGLRSQWRVRWDRVLRRELQRVLRSDALVYSEHLGLLDLLGDGNGPIGVSTGSSSAQRFHLTPRGGELHTAIPDSDHVMADYFRRQSLYSSGASMRRVRQLLTHAQARLARQFSTRPAGAAGQEARRPVNGNSALTAPDGPTSGHWRAQVRGLAADVRPGIDRLLGRHGVLIGAGAEHLTDQPPEYLRTIAAASGVRLEHFRWALSAKGDYSSRKLLFFLTDTKASDGSPTYIAKMVRDPIFNGRLENEYRALCLLRDGQIVDRATVPQPVFFGHHAGLAIVGESIVEGVPFLERSSGSWECPYFHAAIEWFTTLGAASATTEVASPEEIEASIGRLFVRFQELYELTSIERDFLARQVAALGGGRGPLPLTFQHGDPGVWNMLATPNGGVALLDWESAEVRGMPLWDLFYFLRTYAVAAARRTGTRDSLDGFREQLLDSTPLSQASSDAVRGYCARSGLAPALIQPLFYTCWMHRALKEATRLPPAQLGRGRYMALLRFVIASQGAPALHSLLAG